MRVQRRAPSSRLYLTNSRCKLDPAVYISTLAYRTSLSNIASLSRMWSRLLEDEQVFEQCRRFLIRVVHVLELARLIWQFLSSTFLLSLIHFPPSPSPRPLVRPPFNRWSIYITMRSTHQLVALLTSAAQDAKGERHCKH